MSPPPPNLKVLFFDTFGTTVAQRTPVADALFSAAQEALASENSSISDEVRRRADSMVFPSPNSADTQRDTNHSDLRRPMNNGSR